MIVNFRLTAKMDAVGNKQEQGNSAVQRFAEALEESWYITPPSCFNASQTHSSTLETSPLENLLIEHPSMSVYGATEAWLEALEDSASSTDAVEQTPENLPNQFGQTMEPRSSHRRVLRVVDKIELLKRRVQKNVLEQTKKNLRNNKIERQNKTQKHKPRSRRKQKQIDRKEGKHSGVYSNRGC